MLFRSDVNQTLEEIEQSMQLRLRHNNVTCTFVERLPECTLYTDKNRLIQLLANFIVNAIKFTEVGTIRMGYRLLDSETIYFYVSDTGCGMSSEQCIHVFERFVKYNSFVQGTGLGLSCPSINRTIFFSFTRLSYTLLFASVSSCVDPAKDWSKDKTHGKAVKELHTFPYILFQTY